MLIISRFHDYYDTAMTYGIDKSCVYNRESKTVELKTNTLPYTEDFSIKGERVEISGIMVGFCGKIYPMIKVQYKGVRFFSNLESYMTYYNQEFGTLSPRNRGFWNSKIRLDNVVGVKLFFGEAEKDYFGWFLNYNTPIFVIERPKRYGNDTILINPQLSAYDFVKIIDPATAFQEIYMFQAGVLGNKEVDTINISDKDMLKQKGFDQFSFKTMKGDKKPRAKNRGKND